MKIAIFHDYFGAIGGGERTVLSLAQCLDADIITTDIDAVKKIDPSVNVISLGNTVKVPPFKQISATMKFRSCDYSGEYDFFIFTGNWSHHAARRHHPNLWYCYTLVRAFYDLYPVFLARQNVIIRQIFRLWVFFHKRMDQSSVGHIDRIIGISDTVRDRISTYYHRDSSVIFPPVDLDRYRCTEYGDFWLSVNRLYPEKRIELQVEAFRNMPKENLIVVGGFAKGDHAARYAGKLKLESPGNVTFLGEVDEETLIDLYARCKGHICTAMDEDYGLTPVEAMASGKPVIAVNEGGYKETVTPETGIFIGPEIDSLVRAVTEIGNNPGRFHDACIERARKFGKDRFRDKIWEAVYGSGSESFQNEQT